MGLRCFERPTLGMIRWKEDDVCLTGRSAEKGGVRLAMMTDKPHYLSGLPSLEGQYHGRLVHVGAMTWVGP